MEEKIRIQEEISLLDLLLILLRKWKILLVTLLVGIIAGAGLGFMQTNNVNYYGSLMEFYVNPYMLADPDDGNPETGKDEEITSQYGVYGAYGKPVMDNMVKLLDSDIFAEKIVLNLLGGYPSKNLNAELDKAIDDAKKPELTDEEKKTALSAAVELWRDTNDYKNKISFVKGCTAFNYYKGTGTDLDNLAKSFIYVKIQVLNNENTAQRIFNALKKEVSLYVAENMAVPTGYDGTNCQFISTSSTISLLNPGYTQNAVIKYGVLVGAAAFIVACVVLIIIDRSNKRLRDIETLAARFDIPVLGVIPSIEEETANTEVA